MRCCSFVRYDRNEITLELKRESKKKSNAVFPSNSSPSSIRIKYVIRSRNLRQRQRDENLRDIEHVIRKYVGDGKDLQKVVEEEEEDDSLW